jgi:hypothetical protein
MVQRIVDSGCDPFENLPDAHEIVYIDGSPQLYQLNITNPSKISKIPSKSLVEFLQTRLPISLYLVKQNNPHFLSIFLSTLAQRDHLHSKTLYFQNLSLKLEAFPPPVDEAPYFKPKPNIPFTHFRICNIPPEIPLTELEKILSQIQLYIPNSAFFETYANCRKIRNGHLSFFLAGMNRDFPGRFLQIRDQLTEIHRNCPHLPSTPLPNCPLIASTSLPPQIPSNPILPPPITSNFSDETNSDDSNNWDDYISDDEDITNILQNLSFPRKPFKPVHPKTLFKKKSLRFRPSCDFF